MSASLKSTVASRQAKRHAVAERKRLATIEAKKRTEQLNEEKSPRAQRLPALDRRGNVIRGARTERSGVGFVKSNPIRHLVARSEGREHPLVTKRHLDAAYRLSQAYSDSETISAGVSSYEQRGSGTPDTGIISDGVLRNVHLQIRARQEVERIRAGLGALWPVVYNCCIVGMDIASIAEIFGMSAAQASGFVAASLDRLVDLFVPRERHNCIRAVDVVSFHADAAE